MAHFALTDVANAGFRARERFAREAAGLAGAASEPFRVWLDDWELASTGAPFADAARPLHLRAADDGPDPIALELELVPTRAPVLQGDDGLSAKGPEPGNASYYYSLPRLATRGILALGGERYAVSGFSWLDREWSTSSLGEGVVGWDWLALQLDDGSDLTLYRLRRADGAATAESAGSLAAADGSVRRLQASEIDMTPRGIWSSPRGGSYPAGWRISLPSLALELEVEPLVEDQELALSFRYWEGAVRARGSRAGAALAGQGYLEMTGYAPITGAQPLAAGR
jgi:predicted secreted hydrolase